MSARRVQEDDGEPFEEKMEKLAAAEWRDQQAEAAEAGRLRLPRTWSNWVSDSENVRRDYQSSFTKTWSLLVTFHRKKERLD